MFRSGRLFVAAAIAVVPMACKDDVREKADEAAEDVREAEEALREESSELKEAIEDQREDIADHVAGLPERAREIDEKEIEQGAEKLADKSKDVAEKTAELATKESDFELARENRVNQLRAAHVVTASQPMLINAISQMTPLTNKARADLAEKMQVFQMRLDEAGNTIEVLQTVDASKFEDSNDKAATAMERLDDAREDAWKALNDGDRIEPS